MGFEGLENRQMLSVTYPVWIAAQSFGTLLPTVQVASHAGTRVHPFNGTLNSAITGLYPSQVRTAYGLNLLDNKANKNYPAYTNTGLNQNIAIIGTGAQTLQNDLNVFSTSFGLPITNVYRQLALYPTGVQDTTFFTQTAATVEWAHAMAPKAKIFLVESVQVNTDPTWQAVQLAASLVAKAGGGVVSMSWGDPEVKQELGWDKYFTQPGVVYFAASGDSGLGVGIYPGSSPNVVSVGGTSFNRDSSGKFVSESYDGSGGGDLSLYEPRPSFQNGVSHIVGNHRGYPDVAAPFCCASIYLQGAWYSVGGTSWASPVFAGIVNAAGGKQSSSKAELTLMYNELANPSQYKADFNDIIQGGSQCGVGFDPCTGIGSPKTYKGK